MHSNSQPRKPYDSVYFNSDVALKYGGAWVGATCCNFLGNLIAAWSFSLVAASPEQGELDGLINVAQTTKNELVQHVCIFEATVGIWLKPFYRVKGNDCPLSKYTYIFIWTSIWINVYDFLELLRKEHFLQQILCSLWTIRSISIIVHSARTNPTPQAIAPCK